MRAPARFGDGKCLVGIDHYFETVADRRTHCRQARNIFGNRRLADFHLRTAKPLRLGRNRFVDQLLLRMMQPAAFGRVDRHFPLRAARDFP